MEMTLLLLFAAAQDAFQERLLGTAVEGPTTHFAFSADGKHAAFVVRKGERRHVVLDSKEGPGVTDAFHLQLSADGSLLCYGTKEGPQTFVRVADRREGPYKSLVAAPVVSPKGDRVAYAAKEDDKAYVVVGGTPGDPFDQVGAPVFSPDGAQVAHMGEKKKKQFVVAGGQKGAEYDFVYGIVFSKDGKKVAYPAQRDEKSFVVCGDQVQEIAEPSTQVALRGDGTVAAYTSMVRVEGRVFVYVDGKMFAPFPFSRHLVSSDEGTSIAFVAKGGGNEYAVLNGRKGEAFEEVWGPVLSPDGKKVACWAAQDDRTFVVCGDRKGEAVSLEENPAEPGRISGRGPVFSPDGSKVAYGVRKGREFWWKVLDLP